MKLLIHGRNLDVTPALRDYTETKLDRAIHHFNDLVQEADVHLSVARNPRVPQQTAEVTVFANGTVIRAQERSENLYASIDLVASKLARQLRRFWTAPAITITATAIAPPKLQPLKQCSTTALWRNRCWMARKPSSRTPACDASISPCRP